MKNILYWFIEGKTEALKELKRLLFIQILTKSPMELKDISIV